MEKCNRGSSRHEAAMLRLEQLEERIAPAGMVAAKISNGMLTITGDADANSITITDEGLAVGQILITGNDGTIVNGDTSVTLDGFTKDMKISMGVGNDSVNVSDTAAPRGLFADLGADDDVFRLTGGVGANLFIKGGEGADSVYLDVEFGKDVNLDGGNGDNYLSMSADVDGKVTVKNGMGEDDYDINVLVTGGAVSINSGKGGSHMNFYGLLGPSLKITNGDGTDELFFGEAVVSGNVAISNGAGNSTLTMGPTHIGGTLSVRDGAGDDAITMASVTVGAGTSIATGNGRGEVSVESGVFGYLPKGGDLKITVGKGVALVALEDVQVSKNLAISNVGVEASLDIRGAFVSKDFSFKSKEGSDYFYIVDMDVIGKASIDTGAGDDEVSFDGSRLFGAVSVKTGAGDDILYLDAFDEDAGLSSVYESSFNADLGAGDDEVYIGSENQPGNSAVYNGTVKVNGGSGYDLLEHWEANTFAVEPVAAGFEEEIEN